MIGRIHKIAANDYEVHTAEGIFHCRFRGRLKQERQASLKLAAVGDRVEVTAGEAGEGMIEEVLPRDSRLSRHDVMRPSTEQVIVANVDVLLIVHSVRDPDFNTMVLDKCTVMAAANRLPCVVCANKCDLGRPDLSAYEQAGYKVVRSSAKTGEGLEELRALFHGRTVVLLGPSGVGKSSLLNALDPEFHLKVGAVSRRGEGRHTTTWVELVPLAGGLAADTPGLEFFTFWGVTAETVQDFFLDFQERAGGCRYRNCSHTSEVECAVRGAVAPSRYENYLRIRESLFTRRDLVDRG